MSKVKTVVSKNATNVAVVDGRINNTGRPVNKKSVRQVRLSKQKHYIQLMDKFKSGASFIHRGDEYKYNDTCVTNSMGMHVANIDVIGRTKVTLYTFVMGKRVNTTLNLKTIEFVG